MNTVFYILLYIGMACTSNITLTLENRHTGWNPETSCTHSTVETKIVDNLDGILAQKNQFANSGVLIQGPDKIIRVTVKDGKYEQKEVRIVPVTKRIKRTIEQEHEVIEGYRIE